MKLSLQAMLDFLGKSPSRLSLNVFELTRNTVCGLIRSNRTLNIPFIPFTMRCFYSTSSRSQKNSTFLHNNCWFILQICNYSRNLPIFWKELFNLVLNLVKYIQLKDFLLMKSCQKVKSVYRKPIIQHI